MAKPPSQQPTNSRHVETRPQQFILLECTKDPSLLAYGYAISSAIKVKSSQVTFIYIALLTIQIVTKQLHNIKMGK